MVAHRGLVLHVQVGDGSCYGEFSVPANQASSTWWVSKAGLLEQYVDSDDAAWTEAAGNFTWDSVETEGTPDEPLTTEQIATLAKLYAWGMEQYGWPAVLAETPDQLGFGWHGMGGVAWGNHPDCPGDLRRPQRQDILDAVNAPEVLMSVSQSEYFANNYHAFQVSGNVLWHKWWTFGQTTNGNEDVVKASGLAAGAVSFPDKVPQIGLANNQLCVCVEDSTGKAWFFSQSAGAAWGAKELA